MNCTRSTSKPAVSAVKTTLRSGLLTCPIVCRNMPTHISPGSITPSLALAMWVPCFTQSATLHHMSFSLLLPRFLQVGSNLATLALTVFVVSLNTGQEGDLMCPFQSLSAGRFFRCTLGQIWYLSPHSLRSRSAVKAWFNINFQITKNQSGRRFINAEKQQTPIIRRS